MGNILYMPVVTVDVGRIPEWDAAFVSRKREDGYSINLIGVEESVTGEFYPDLSSERRCNELNCASLSQGLVLSTWNLYKDSYDGIFKHGGTYFLWRGPINTDLLLQKTDACRDVPLWSVPLTKQEAVVLDEWLPTSIATGARWCSALGDGTHLYASGITDDIKSLVEIRLNELIKTLVCAETDAEPADCNKLNLPLDIPLEKVIGLRNDLVWENAKQVGVYAGGAVGFLLSAFVLGVSFHYAPRIVEKVLPKAGPPGAAIMLGLAAGAAILGLATESKAATTKKRNPVYTTDEEYTKKVSYLSCLAESAGPLVELADFLLDTQEAY